MAKGICGSVYYESTCECGSSYYSTIAERSIRMNGMDYNMELSEPTDRQVEEVRSMESVEADCPVTFSIESYGDNIA